jgi:activator of 2-hydroxyglutaryl-CoA dehydratase
MASRLDVSLETLNALAAEATEMIKLGSYCTVFSATEVLENIRAGRRVPDIVKGLFYSVIKRVLEMDSLTDGVVMTGGVVAHNPYLAEMTAGLIERPVRLPAQPQFVGALGAALFARDAAAGQVAADAPPDQGD